MASFDLKNKQSPMRVAVIGGGPAGTFFAFSFLKQARDRGLPVEVVIFEPKKFEERGAPNCNYCQGVISAGLLFAMENIGLELPSRIIQAKIESYHLVTLEGDIRLSAPRNQHIYTVYRGHGPHLEQAGSISFDQFLLEHALALGAEKIAAEIERVELKPGAQDPVILVDMKGMIHRADMLVGAFGVNCKIGEQFEKLGFGYRWPLKDSALQAEYRIADDFILQRFGNEIKIFTLGLSPIRFGVITPKLGHITVSLIGEKLTLEHLELFMRHPRVKEHLPSSLVLAGPICCCAPLFPITDGGRLAAPHCIIIGDAAVSRYYKNGIESALHSAELAARVLVEYGPGEAAPLRRYYSRKVKAAFRLDNSMGRLLFRMHDWISHLPSMTRAYLDLAGTDRGSKGHSRRQLRWILWNMFTGDAPYKKIFLHCLDPGMLSHLILTTLRTRFTTGRHALKAAGVLDNGVTDPLRVLIVGGGPAGASCALSLVRLASQMKRRVKIILFEHKTFGKHYNQCMGVLSPPIVTILREYLDLALPGELIQREIHGYWLHTDCKSIYLTDLSSASPEPSIATRRVLLDGYLLSQVEKAGVEVCRNRVMDLEFTDEAVNLYTEGGSFEGDILVGAFGLDRQMCEALSRRTGYRPPDYLETVVTKIHPGQELVDSFGNYIHAFLPRNSAVEFGALVPKGNHITALVAGRKVTAATLTEFLRSPAVTSIMTFPYGIKDMYKGNFPISPAKGFYGDRFIAIGDSAGLVRPFKGKGINSAICTGHSAARIILERGITKNALSQIENDCRELIGDRWYGRIVRWLTISLARFSFFDPILEVAGSDPNLRQALFDSVSGQDTYRNILARIVSSPSLILSLARAFASHQIKKCGPAA
ncbi:MAG TPA: NAD(P)/FAD-dependent oxidoreductase [archaeon]|nr:NAD(P)/FAD-dependent oxidoreductase [archaeon]